MKQTSAPARRFTPLQGQYLVFIRTYTLIHREPPAEADMQRFFGVTPPSVHNMILTLAERGLIERVPGKPRSLRVLVPSEELPQLEEPATHDGR
jgi:Mn-dependent DtxR family transcriptional regulator